MLIMGFGTSTAKVQFKYLVKQSRVYIQKKNRKNSSAYISTIEIEKMPNPVIQKANKIAFQLSNYLRPKAMFGSLRVQTLQQPSTRLFQYALQAKLPASEESTSLIYPRAHMYPIFEQEIRGKYKAKSDIYQVYSSFLWMSGAIAILMIWPYVKKHPSFMYQIKNKRNLSIVQKKDRKGEKATLDKRFFICETTKTKFNLLSILSTQNKVFPKNFTYFFEENTLQINNNT